MATTEEKDAAVAKLEAAGTDLSRLSAALNETKFLENIPGDHRQKFRGTFKRFFFFGKSFALQRQSHSIES